MKDTATTARVEDIKKGTLVKRTATAKYCFLRGDFCRYNKRYELEGYNGTTDYIHVKKGTVLFLEWDTTDENEF